LELLRQRLVNPVLEVKSMRLIPEQVKRTEKSIFLAMKIHFEGENVGRVAAYKRQLQVREMDGHPKGRLQDYVFDRSKYPLGMSFAGGIRMDDTILPGSWFNEDIHFGVHLKPTSEAPEQLRLEIEQVLCSVTLGYRIATETSPGELRHVKLVNGIDVDKLVEFICAQVNTEAP
jgi:hypothetical protein